MQRAPAQRRPIPTGGPPRRYDDHATHATSIEADVDNAFASFQNRTAQALDFDPKMILVVEFRGAISDDEIRRAGLTALDTSVRSASVVFAGDTQLTAFRARLNEYRTGPRPRLDREGMGGAKYEKFFDAIEAIRPRTEADRVSDRLAESLDDEPDDVLFDIECWFVDDIGRTEEWLRTIQSRLEAFDGVWLDEFVSASAGVALARARGSYQAVMAVAVLDEVATLDTVPQPQIERPELTDLQAIDEVEVVDVDPDAPVVGIVDSGVRGGHPLLAPALIDSVALHPDLAGQAEDGHGHGTGVAGVALYGDVLSSARTRSFNPSFHLASVRVLDEEARVPENASFVRVITDAIRYLVNTWDCRIVNISIGDSSSPYSGGKSSPTAAALDALARALDVVLVVSSGNLHESDLLPFDDVLGRYPKYLLEVDNGILNPSQSLLALTVGGRTRLDGTTPPTLAGTGLEAQAIAQRGAPAPFTRRGPGPMQAIKPELCEESGNLVYDHAQQRVRRDIATSVLSTSGDWPSRVFSTHIGTSFSAPKVANLAGRIAAEYPGLSANSIRALILQGAVNTELRDALSGHYEGAELDKGVWSLGGFGLPTWDRCGQSNDNRVVMFAEDSIRPDSFHVYRVPITEAFAETPAHHELAVSLAFDPPVRHHRFDYTAHKMEFTVVRGVSLERVFELASIDAADEDDQLSQSEYVAMRPPRSTRSRGVNQAAVATSSQRPRSQFRDDWYIVVKSVNRWLSDDAGPQRYSLAVGIAAENGVNLYAEVQQQIELEAAAEIRT